MDTQRLVRLATVTRKDPQWRSLEAAYNALEIKCYKCKAGHAVLISGLRENEGFITKCHLCGKFNYYNKHGQAIRKVSYKTIASKLGDFLDRQLDFFNLPERRENTNGLQKHFQE